ncbi:carboxylesterase/lipase family protein [Stenotrophomonas mori]|uniref:Carboxylic ester hydrolase n=1 Tax=Stenotrophomonas mori TaxID=2871096 RepID=A0ABT0SK29_9GAMM|nr:carboxylesterase family protein [Stenotrophomonas mori]MCL7715325.1 carboxylesterase family protein [Stenotrophomonas mori]
MKRRSVIAAIPGALIGLGLATVAGAGTPDRRPVVTTGHGRLRGLRLDAGFAFLGVPYAAPPVGPLRLRSPRPVAGWTGVRDAALVGPASLQSLQGNQRWLNEPPAALSEDCLYLNVWTPTLDSGAALPVLVWVHGGATRSGQGGAAAVDGRRLAARGLVVVTLNYRLGALGGLAHPALEDPETGMCANWGLQDKLAALRWVADNIAAFGGDPAKVTLGGQSSGAANVALIAHNRLGDGLFRGAIAHSPPLFRPPMFAEMASATAYTEALCDQLGITVPAVRGLDGDVLQRQEEAFAGSAGLKARMQRPATAPVRDGRLLRTWSYDAEPMTVPLLAGWTRSEADFWFALDDGAGTRLSPLAPPASAGELRTRTRSLIDAHYAFPEQPDAAGVIDAYGGEADPASTWRRLYTDLVFRAPILHLLGRQARAGQPAWAYEFAFPLAGSTDSSPHASDVPFVFGTTDTPYLAAKIGRAPQAQRTAERMMRCWTRFIAEGSPAAPAAWSRFDPGRASALRFTEEGAQVVAVHTPATSGLWPRFSIGPSSPPPAHP